jgi:hypothetical protein
VSFSGTIDCPTQPCMCSSVTLKDSRSLLRDTMPRRLAGRALSTPRDVVGAQGELRSARISHRPALRPPSIERPSETVAKWCGDHL